MAYNPGTSTLHPQFNLSFDPTMALEATAFPFSCVLSLEPLIRLWVQYAAAGHPGSTVLAQRIHEELEQAPELLAPIEDLAVLTKHKKLLDLLMSLIFPRRSGIETMGQRIFPTNSAVFMRRRRLLPCSWPQMATLVIICRLMRIPCPASGLSELMWTSCGSSITLRSTLNFPLF